MALIICPECGSQISDTAKVCPKCGYVLKPFLKQIGTEIYRCKKTLIEWCENIFRSIKEKKQQRKANRDIKYYKNWITTKKVLRNISVFCVFTLTYAGVESAKTGASHIGLFLFWMLPAIFMGVLSLIIQYKLEQDIPEDIANELKFKNIFNTQEEFSNENGGEQSQNKEDVEVKNDDFTKELEQNKKDDDIKTWPFVIISTLIFLLGLFLIFWNTEKKTSDTPEKNPVKAVSTTTFWDIYELDCDLPHAYSNGKYEKECWGNNHISGKKLEVTRAKFVDFDLLPNEVIQSWQQLIETDTTIIISKQNSFNITEIKYYNVKIIPFYEISINTFKMELMDTLFVEFTSTEPVEDIYLKNIINSIRIKENANCSDYYHRRLMNDYEERDTIFNSRYCCFTYPIKWKGSIPPNEMLFECESENRTVYFVIDRLELPTKISYEELKSIVLSTSKEDEHLLLLSYNFKGYKSYNYSGYINTPLGTAFYSQDDIFDEKNNAIYEIMSYTFTSATDKDKRNLKKMKNSFTIKF